MIFYNVEPKHVDSAWPSVVTLLKKPLSRGLGEYSLEHLLMWLKDGQQQLWVGIDENKDQEIVLAVTTQIYIWPNQKHLRIHLLGGKKHTIKDWEDQIEVLEKYCNENGIRYIEGQGRDGWLKLGKKRGYFKYYSLVAKEMNNANI